MKNGVKNHLLKLKKRQKKMNKIRIFDGFECLLAFILMSFHNCVRSFDVGPNKVREGIYLLVYRSIHEIESRVAVPSVSAKFYMPNINYILMCQHQTFAKSFVSS